MHFTVYQTTNLVNGKIYVGFHATKNPNDSYLGSGIALRSALKKYGRANFRKEVLFDFKTAEEMEAKEGEIVNAEFCAREDTYNLAKGGRQTLAGFTAADMARWGSLGQQQFAARSDALAIRQECGRRLAAANRATGRLRGKQTWLGRKHSEETKVRMAAVDRAGEKNSQYGTAWINKEGEVKKVPRTELPGWLENGWQAGKRVRLPRASAPRHSPRPNAKLTWEMVREIRAACSAGARHWELAERFGVSRVGITLIVNNRTWRE